MILDEFLIKLGVISDSQQLNEFNAGLGAITQTASVLVGTLTGLTAGVTAFFGSALSELDRLNILASQTDTSLAYIQQLGYAASVSGASVEAANASIKGLAKSIGEAATGMGRGEAAFKKLGIQATDANGVVRSVADVLLEVNQRMQSLSRSEQLNLLSKLGIDPALVGILGSTQSEIAALFDEAHALGLITADGADAAQAYNDAMTQMGAVMQAVRTQIAIGLAPQLTRLMSGLKTWLIENKALVQNGISVLVDWLLATGQAVMNVMRAIHQVIDSTLGWQTTLIGLIGVLVWVKRATLAAFAVNPVLWIVAAITGLFLLVDDLFTFLNGGQSALDWSWAVPILELCQAVVMLLYQAFSALFEMLFSLGKSAFAFLSACWTEYGDQVLAGIDAIIAAFGFASTAISDAWGRVMNLLKRAWDNTLGIILSGVERVKGALNWIGEKLGLTTSDVAEVERQANQAMQRVQTGATYAVDSVQDAAMQSPYSAIHRQVANVQHRQEVNNTAHVQNTIHVQGNNPHELAKQVEDRLHRSTQQATANYWSPVKL